MALVVVRMVLLCKEIDHMQKKQMELTRQGTGYHEQRRLDKSIPPHHLDDQINAGKRKCRVAFGSLLIWGFLSLKKIYNLSIIHWV